MPVSALDPPYEPTIRLPLGGLGDTQSTLRAHGQQTAEAVDTTGQKESTDPELQVQQPEGQAAELASSGGEHDEYWR